MKREREGKDRGRRGEKVTWLSEAPTHPQGVEHTLSDAFDLVILSKYL